MTLYRESLSWTWWSNNSVRFTKLLQTHQCTSITQGTPFENLKLYLNRRWTALVIFISEWKCCIFFMSSKLGTARFAVSTDVRCKSPQKVILAMFANFCSFKRLIRLPQGLINGKVFNIDFCCCCCCFFIPDVVPSGVAFRSLSLPWQSG